MHLGALCRWAIVVNGILRPVRMGMEEAGRKRVYRVAVYAAMGLMLILVALFVGVQTPAAMHKGDK